MPVSTPGGEPAAIIRLFADDLRGCDFWRFSRLWHQRWRLRRQLSLPDLSHSRYGCSSGRFVDALEIGPANCHAQLHQALDKIRLAGLHFDDDRVTG